MTDDVDPEILFAAALGVTLARMRAELDEYAVKRVMTFVLSRWGIRATELYVNTLPSGRMIAHPRVAEVFPDAPPPPLAKAEPRESVVDGMPPPNRQPIHSEACPICGRTGINPAGLNMHMFRSHGTTLKEYRRTRSLDA